MATSTTPPLKKIKKKKKGASHDCHSRNMIEVDLVMEKYPPIKQKPLNNFIRKLGMWNQNFYDTFPPFQFHINMIWWTSNFLATFFHRYLFV